MSDNSDKLSLLVYVSKLYYEHNYSQSMVAEKLNISRPYVSKLLAEARALGVVTIQVNDPTKTETAPEKTLRTQFDLRKAIVAPKNEKPLSTVSNLCAKYVNEIINNTDIIGVSWGETLYSCSQSAINRTDLSDVVIVQLCGGISNVERNTYATEIVRNFATAFNGTPYVLPLPAIFEDVRTKTTMLKDRNLCRVMNLMEKVNIAVFTIGTFGKESALYNAGYISNKQMEALIKTGAVGDICSHIIDIDGNICNQEIDERTVAMPIAKLKNVDCRIAVAIGSHKAKSIYGALKGGYCNVLITDEDTANLVIDIAK